MKLRNALSLLFVAMLASAAAAAPEQSMKIAVVNLSRALQEMHETKDVRDKFEAKHKELDDKAEQKRAAVTGILQQLRQLRPGSPQAREMAAQLDAAKADYDAFAAVRQAMIERDEKFETVALYNKIEVAVAEVAKQENLDLVLPDARQDIIVEGASLADVRHQMATRGVLFASKNVDITEKVIAVLDKNYAASKK